MWFVFFILSLSSLILFCIFTNIFNLIFRKNSKKISVLYMLFAGTFLSALFIFLPPNISAADDGFFRPVLLSLFNSMQIFVMGTDYSAVSDSIAFCNESLKYYYLLWTAFLYVLAPAFTFGFILSLFKNICAHIKYLCMYFKKVYIFSQLNEKSLALASDIKKKDCKAGIVFNGVFVEDTQQSLELSQRAKQLNAVLFKKDILDVKYAHHSSRDIFFFAIGENETENLNQAIELINKYKDINNTNLYVFSTKVESELLLNTLEKGKIKVRRINEVQSLINRILYERGEIVFENAVMSDSGQKNISAIVIGMGSYGTEMVKSLTWFGQMDGYSIKITAFDKDPLAEEKFTALVPEIMSVKYNGVFVEGEAQYTIKINSDCDIQTAKFSNEISKLKDATYVFVALGNDDMNIKTAVNLRMLFERIGAHPVIQAVLSNSSQKNALTGIKNYQGQQYDIEFIGDIESSYAKNVIINSELEEDALQRHLKWGKEEDFWAYEYCYRSSVASAIHMKARIKCNISGADKTTQELTNEQRNIIELLEHKRWNAYVRTQGYVYSGSPDKSSRNDLAKMHHNLVDFSMLSEEDKRKDSNVGSK